MTYGRGNPFFIYYNGILSIGYTIIQILKKMSYFFHIYVRDYFKTSIYQM